MDTIALTDLDERYARLRIAHPGAERAVRDSLRRLGQLTPIVVCERGEVQAVVDGFKRVAAARTLGFASLRGRVMPLGETAALAALVSLNCAGRGLTDLEEGLVVRTLCREHGLEQVAVAVLLGRHKSWVSRRLSLVERLADEVATDVRAGLISTTVARDVARLPRGNQADVATTIRREGLTSREAALLVTLFAKTSGFAQQRHLLERPREALDAHGPRVPLVAHDPRLGALTQALRVQLFATMRAMTDLSARLAAATPATWTATERLVLGPVFAQARGGAELLLSKLIDAHGATETGHARG